MVENFTEGLVPCECHQVMLRTLQSEEEGLSVKMLKT